MCLDLIFSFPAGFAGIPGSELTQLDLEKLFLLSVSKEHIVFETKQEKNLPCNILNTHIFLTSTSA